MVEGVRQGQTTDFVDEKLWEAGVCFDPESIRLDGYYPDEISAHRAKRVWTEALEGHFLLEQSEDFDMQVLRSESNEEFFRLSCNFKTACARYAFWRLTNSQAPEAQYVIETAHIPRAESQSESFLFAPDMRSVEEGPLVLGQGPDSLELNHSWFERVKSLISRLAKET